MADLGTDLTAPPQVAHAVAVIDRLVTQLPPWWREHGSLGLENWQWLAIPVFAVLVWLSTWLLVKATTWGVKRLTRSRPQLQRALIAQSGPIRLFWTCWLGRGVVRIIGIHEGAFAWVDVLFKAGAALAFFWGVLRALRDWTEQFINSKAATSRPGSRALVSLVSRVGQILLMSFGALLVLAEFGFPVQNVVAGLGIGGIALALGAQKTLEHLFGALALTVDQPIREGDAINADGLVSGTVERIGLRSTQIRTGERSVVSIPNGKLADMRLENFAQRDRYRFATIVTLVYGTTAAQMEEVLAGFKQVLGDEKQLWPGGMNVNFAALADWSLNVEVEAWFNVSGIDEYRQIRGRVLLGFMKVVEKAGTDFAFPTRTLELKQDAPSTPPLPRAGEGRSAG